jgi:hypothetical protein
MKKIYKMHQTCSMQGEMAHKRRILDGKPGGKKPLGRPRNKSENINITKFFFWKVMSRSLINTY